MNLGVAVLWDAQIARPDVHALVVEDDLTFCEFLTELLKGNGFEVSSAGDGVRGYELCQAKSFDVVIIDVRMPLVLGTDLAEALKQDRPAARIILISAFADAVLRRAAADLGATLLSKPFSAGEFLAALDQTILGRA